MSIFDQYQSVIGLECHVQLLTQSKLFSPAPNHFGDEANTNTDLIDFGLPGVLPLPNKKAVELAIRLGIALNCEIRQTHIFDRKHYFYPDLPKGYQITQLTKAICINGYLDIEISGASKRIRIEQIHIEEDAGKNIHNSEAKQSYCDYNRAGTPLLEVVTAPDLHSADEAMAYMKALREIVIFTGVGDGNMQEGSMRADANVSVMKKNATELGTRTETKNLNSIRFLGQAIDFEAQRQVLELESGHQIQQETRLWDPDKKESRTMRSKADAHDYRYFPDPDLMPFHVSDQELQDVKDKLPELPSTKRKRYQETLQLSEYDAESLCATPEIAKYFEQAIQFHDNPKGISNFIQNEIMALHNKLNKEAMRQFIADECIIQAEYLAELVALIDSKKN